jgi:hypothetical protein
VELGFKESNVRLVIRWANIWPLSAKVRGNTGETPKGNAPEFPDISVGAERPATSEFLSLRES